MSAEDLAAALRRPRAGAAPRGALGADGVNLLNACSAAAWQTVFHFHVHVIPATTTIRCACRGPRAGRSRRDRRRRAGTRGA